MNLKPAWIPPMLATLIDKPFDSDEWLFEIKWDGYRTLAYTDKKEVHLYSRNHHSFNTIFEPIVEALQALKVDAIFDGEVVALDKEGISRFELIQNIRKGAKACFYYIFDLLYYDGKDMLDVPLIERKDLLKQILKKAKSPLLHFSDHVESKGIAFFKAAGKKHLEGIMGKKKNSLYVSKRSAEWVKIKTKNRHEMVIGGFTEPKGSRKHFGALLLGIPSDEGLQYVGDVGTGFDEKTLDAVFHKLRPLIQKQSPFITTPKSRAKATWVKPKLVCEVSFTEWTTDHKLRHPVFHGLRIDKSASEITEEVKNEYKSPDK